MLINAKNLQNLPVLSEDRERYKYIDCVFDSSGLFVKALIVRHQGLKSTTEYVIPPSCLKVIYPGDGVYLNKEAEELEEYQVASEPPDFEKLRSFGIEISNAITPLTVDRDAYLNSSGLNCFFLEDLLRFKVQCTDEKLGKTRDILLHPITLGTHYVVVEVGHSFSKKWSYVPAQYIDRIDWTQRVGHLNVPKERVKSGPLFKPHTEVNDDLEQKLNRDIPQTIWSNWYEPPQVSDDWRYLDF